MNGLSTVAVRVGFVTLIPIIIGCVRFAPELIVRSARVRELIKPAIARQGAIAGQRTTLLSLTSLTSLSLSSSLSSPGAAFQRHEEDEDDVANAVAEYQLDADGSLYEVHSPQTQLPRLGSPKS